MEQEQGHPTLAYLGCVSLDGKTEDRWHRALGIHVLKDRIVLDSVRTRALRDVVAQVSTGQCWECETQKPLTIPLPYQAANGQRSYLLVQDDNATNHDLFDSKEATNDA